MASPRMRILAIEPEPTCRANLQALLNERLIADVVVVDTPDAAGKAARGRRPDLVLLSAVMPPRMEEQLLKLLKQLDPEGAVPILTIPPVITSSAPAENDRRFFKFLRRRTQAPPFAYDAAAVAARIGETLAQLRTAGVRTKLKPVPTSAAAVDSRLAIAAGAADPIRKLTLVSKPPAPEMPRVPPRARKRRAHRLTAAELPWPCALTTSKGVAVRLLNISTSGILFESSLKFMPETDASLYLSGPDTKLTLPARFVRSEVSSVDGLGVKYQTAARFSHKVKLFSALSENKQADEGSPQALAELLVAVIANFNLNGDCKAARRGFEAGLRHMVPSCDIRLHDAVIKPADGCDSIYFTVPSPTGQANAILQVTFDPDHEPSVEEFKLLRSAAGMASVIVQFESTAAATRTA